MPKGELSTHSVVLDALRQEKRVFIPFIGSTKQPGPDSSKSVMDMVSLHSQEDYISLEPDSWGIPTPSVSSTEKRTRILGDDDLVSKEPIGSANGTENLDLVIVPGIAFDQKLNRLGHGKGFYDLFFQRYQQIKVTPNGGQIKMPFLGKSLRFTRLPFSRLIQNLQLV